MGFNQTIPVAGIILAMVSVAALIVLDVDPILAISVLILWIGSLMVAFSKPPEPPTVVVEQKFSTDSIRQLVENSSTPILVTEHNNISVANRSARRMLGQHIVGQDARVTFRQPEAISLLGQESNGQAIVRGLVRRQDIWQINRQAIDQRIAIIELTNQTAEADISRAHTDFVANASHELRTPLAAILGYVETLNENSDTLDSQTSNRFLGTIQREAERLHSLISDLMSLSRVEAEKHDLPSDILNLNEVVERAARDAAGTERLDRLQMEFLSDINVKGDRGQLEQVVRNLVDNALKYGDSDKPVKVTLDDAHDGQAKIVVKDEGEGIAPDQIPHLTRRFYRTDPGRSRASGGTGLGLAIVKHIIERHRGRLDIESALQKGTQITVRLPVSSKRPKQQKQTVSTLKDKSETQRA